MCVAVPMKIVRIGGKEADVEMEGVKRTISIELLHQARVGDYVIVHAGFAIERLDRKEARKTLALFREIS